MKIFSVYGTVCGVSSSLPAGNNFHPSLSSLDCASSGTEPVRRKGTYLPRLLPTVSHRDIQGSHHMQIVLLFRVLGD